MGVNHFYGSIDLQKVGQLLNSRLHVVTTAQRGTLAGTLNSGHVGLIVYDSDLDDIFKWDGTAFNGSPTGAGGIQFIGGIAHNASEPSSPANGDMYVFTSAGTVTWNSQSEVVEVGDFAIWNDADSEWVIIQGNVVDATETVKGVIEIANTSEAQAGTDDTRAMTPAKVAAYASNQGLAKSYFEDSITLTANVAYTIEHNLALQNRNAFVIEVFDSTHNRIYMDVDSVDANNATIESAIAATGVKVMVIGR